MTTLSNVSFVPGTDSMENLGPVIFDESQSQNLENISSAGGVTSEQVLAEEDVDIDIIQSQNQNEDQRRQTTTFIQFGPNFDFPQTKENERELNQNIFVDFVEEMSNTEPVLSQMVTVVGSNSTFGQFDQQSSFDGFKVGESSGQNQVKLQFQDNLGQPS